jgi:hypothetical protein
MERKVRSGPSEDLSEPGRRSPRITNFVNLGAEVVIEPEGSSGRITNTRTLVVPRPGNDWGSNYCTMTAAGEEDRTWGRFREECCRLQDEQKEVVYQLLL